MWNWGNRNTESCRWDQILIMRCWRSACHYGCGTDQSWITESQTGGLPRGFETPLKFRPQETLWHRRLTEIATAKNSGPFVSACARGWKDQGSVQLTSHNSQILPHIVHMVLLAMKPNQCVFYLWKTHWNFTTESFFFCSFTFREFSGFCLHCKCTSLVWPHGGRTTEMQTHQYEETKPQIANVGWSPQILHWVSKSTKTST